MYLKDTKHQYSKLSELSKNELVHVYAGMKSAIEKLKNEKIDPELFQKTLISDGSRSTKNFLMISIITMAYKANYSDQLLRTIKDIKGCAP